MIYKNSLIFATTMLVFTACGGSKSYARAPMSGSSMKIYNQAYSDNNNQDKLKSIILEAKDSYILLDPFDLYSDGYKDISSAISKLKTNRNLVGGYISIGTAEDWRDDFGELKKCATTIEWKDWKGEFFITDTNCALPIMKKRLDRLSSWGFDFVEFDNMDWFSDEDIKDKSGNKITPNELDAKKYANALCSYAHSKGLKCMAKNIISGFDKFDGVLYESYGDDVTNIKAGKKPWWDDSKSQIMSFLDRSKLVIINHYGATKADCDEAYKAYKGYYLDKISFICEAKKESRYIHY